MNNQPTRLVWYSEFMVGDIVIFPHSKGYLPIELYLNRDTNEVFFYEDKDGEPALFWKTMCIPTRYLAFKHRMSTENPRVTRTINAIIPVMEGEAFIIIHKGTRKNRQMVVYLKSTLRDLFLRIPFRPAQQCFFHGEKCNAHAPRYETYFDVHTWNKAKISRERFLYWYETWGITEE